MRGVVLPEGRDHRGRRTSAFQREILDFRASGGEGLRGGGLDHALRRFVEQGNEVGAFQQIDRSRQHLRAGGIGFLYREAVGVDDHHRFGNRAKQRLIARLNFAQPRIIAIEVLLRFDKTLLERGDAAQIAPDGDDAVVVARPHRSVLDRNIRPVRGRMIDLAPHRGPRRDAVEQVLDLAPAFDGDRFNPFAPAPGVAAIARELFIADGDILDDAVVDDQRDIGGGGDDFRR